MIIEAFVRQKINEHTIDCLVSINKHYTRQQQLMFYPLKKKNDTFRVDDILHRGIYIWKHPFFKSETNYLGKIFYTKDNKIFVINQAIEEIYKKIE